ncbi:MAG: hypothetical protein U9N31_04455 [Candidatus Marinimicrobia bacterium]|nr:hypothetical protein [Candidatus Neomarinimicrobiota bacterium]
MKSINQFIALILLAWMGLFTQISTSHMGHAHDLLPSEASLCAIDCDEESHHFAGVACQWFMVKRLTNNDGIISTVDQIPIEFETIHWTPQYFLSTASQNFVHWDRGPPVV